METGIQDGRVWEAWEGSARYDQRSFFTTVENGDVKESHSAFSGVDDFSVVLCWFRDHFVHRSPGECIIFIVSLFYCLSLQRFMGSCPVLAWFFRGTLFPPFALVRGQ